MNKAQAPEMKPPGLFTPSNVRAGQRKVMQLYTRDKIKEREGVKMEETLQKYDDRLRRVESRVSIVETKIDDTRDDIKGIKGFQEKMVVWLIGIMGTSIVSLILLIINLKK